MIKPIFLISLPRSGSTLIQRVLMSHSKISSTAEPHFLLPLIHSFKKTGTITKYSHLSSYQGVIDMINNLPNGINDYYKYINEFSSKVYTSLSTPESSYFLDKTPRYFWIIHELKEIFPDAKYIFLFRNPIQIYASVLSTFGNNKFNKLYEFNRTLDEGFELLSAGFEKFKDNSIGIQYEKFILEPEITIKKINTFLELDYEVEEIANFSKQDLKGVSKDPTGMKLYTKIDDAPLNKWKSILNSPFRKRVSSSYIKSLSDSSLSIQGYNKKEILNEIFQLNNKGEFSLPRDVMDYSKAKLIEKYKLNLFFADNMKWSNNHYLC